MSYDLQINDDYSAPLASNQGYGDLGQWIDSLPVKDYPQLSHLWEWGWCQKPDELRDELAKAIKLSPPKQSSVKETAGGLLALLDEYDGDLKVATVSGGLSE